MSLDALENASVLILGLGREGMSTLSFLREHFPYKAVGLADQRCLSELEKCAREIIVSDRNTELFLGISYLESLQRYDIVFKSAGIPLSIPKIADALRFGKITSNTKLFFECCPGTVVGVTGTKGKSTTASLIYKVLKAGGLDARLIGNIGAPPLAFLGGSTSRTIFVAELSSHQLLGLGRSPHIAILLNIVSEHLDYYGDFQAYVSAKKTISRHQGENDYLIFNPTHSIPAGFADESAAQKFLFGLEPREENGCYLDGEFLVFCHYETREKIIPIRDISLRGMFNLENVMPAVITGKIFGIPNDVISAAIKNFKSLEHRLEFTGAFGGILFYNDSLATVPEATIAAIRSFPGEEIMLIAGGFDRGQNFLELGKAILANNVKKLILFPSTGERIWRDVAFLASDDTRIPQHVFVSTMREAVEESLETATRGGIVLLSPASASFGCFKDYIDRGNQFKKEVDAIVNWKK